MNHRRKILYVLLILFGVTLFGMGFADIVLKILGQELLSLAASWAVCLILVLYWGSC